LGVSQTSNVANLKPIGQSDGNAIGEDYSEMRNISIVALLLSSNLIGFIISVAFSLSVYVPVPSGERIPSPRTLGVPARSVVII
jgi:hypothetical protein